MDVCCEICRTRLQYDNPFTDFRLTKSEHTCGKNMKNITETHTTIESWANLPKYLNEYYNVVGSLLGRNLIQSQQFCTNTHFLTTYLHLILPFISINTMIEMSTIDYDWVSHADFLVKYSILFNDKDQIEDILLTLQNNFNINYLDFDLDFLCDIDVSNTFITYQKIGKLLDMGFVFKQKPLLRLAFVTRLDEELIDRLVYECGLDMKLCLEKFTCVISSLSLTQVDVLIKYIGDPNYVASQFFKQDRLVNHLKNLIVNHQANLESAIFDYNQ
jgi:hypothetical protein